MRDVKVGMLEEEEREEEEEKEKADRAGKKNKLKDVWM